MVIYAQDINNSTGGMLINAQDTNNSTGGMVINIEDIEHGVISVLTVNFHPPVLQLVS